MHSVLKKFFTKIGDALYPDNYSCILCGREIKPSRYGLCLDCSFELNDGKVCQTCGTPMNTESDFCIACSAAKRGFKAARSALIYDDKLHRPVHDLKFGSAKWLVKYLAAYMCDLFLRLNWNIDVIIPVPLSAEKLKVRGFNQSMELACVLADIFSLPIEADILIKVKDTPDQASLKYSERLVNLQDAYGINPDTNNLNGKNILLVDDIITTGSTAEACSSALRRLKPNDIYVLTLATPRRRLTTTEI